MLRAVYSICSIFAFFVLVLILILVLTVESFAKPNFQFTPSVSVSEVYDSNVYSASSSTEDYVSRIGTNLAASYSGPNIEFNGGYLLNFNSYASQHKANVFTHGGNINIGLDRWFQRLLIGSGGGRLTVTEGFTFTPDLSDNSQRGNGLDNYGIKIKRNNIFRNSAGVNFSLPITQRFNLDTNYSNTLTNYSSPLYKDNITNTLGLGGGYSLKKDLLYSNISISSARSGQEDSNYYSIALGVKHPLSQSISLDANTGVSLVAAETGKNQTATRGNVNLSKRMEWHTFSAGYSRSLNSTSGISGTPVIADVYSLNLSNIHSQFLSSGIEASYSTNKSIKGSDVDTQSYHISGNLNYTIRKWLTCSFSMSHFNQLSQIATISEMKRNQITLSIVSRWL
ncbi:MAG: hypothetical protein HZA08_14245 [Nitrospirae bacterium]|nr:hypothetical protein [Nitrospirota bacterium]